MTNRNKQEFVVYSPNEMASDGEAGFWSNEDGWTTLAGATRFTPDEAASLSLPLSTGDDAKWVDYREVERHYG